MIKTEYEYFKSWILDLWKILIKLPFFSHNKKFIKYGKLIKSNPSNQNWTSDLEMPALYLYSLPLYQLSYRGILKNLFIWVVIWTFKLKYIQLWPLIKNDLYCFIYLTKNHQQGKHKKTLFYQIKHFKNCKDQNFAVDNFCRRCEKSYNRYIFD